MVLGIPHVPPRFQGENEYGALGTAHVWDPMPHGQHRRKRVKLRIIRRPLSESPMAASALHGKTRVLGLEPVSLNAGHNGSALKAYGCGDFRSTDQEIEIANLLLITPHSNIHDYYSMRFDSLSDFNDYINKVRMYADFNQSIISFKDID